MLSEIFSQRSETCEGKEKIEEYGGDYIQRRLTEVSFARKVILQNPKEKTMPHRTNKYPPKTLVSLIEVKVYAATFVDGQQYSDTRLVAKIGDNIHFLHPEGVDSKIRQPAGWLKEKVLEMAPMVSAPDEPVEVPEDNVSALPTGSDG